jgi:hypothetical protein
MTMRSRPVDHLVDVARQVRADGLDARTVEEDVGPRQGPELVVHREDEGVGDERSCHGISLR